MGMLAIIKKLFTKNKSIKTTRVIAPEYTYHRGVFVRMEGEKTKYFQTQKAAEEFIAETYGVELSQRSVLYALRKDGWVCYGKRNARIRLARVSYFNDIEF
jgi:hypothetical protein